MSSQDWIDEIYRESRLADGWSSERVLEQILAEIAPTRGLPEMRFAFDRRPFDSTKMVLDAWGVQSDDSLGTQNGLPGSVLHLVGFLDSDSTRETELSLERTGDAIRGMIAFYARSARDNTPLHSITGANDAPWQPAKYIHESKQEIKHVQFILITTLRGDQERLQRLADNVLASAGLPVSASVELWTRVKLVQLRDHGVPSDQVILDLSEQDQGNEDQLPAPHPVIESGVPGGWEVYSTTFTGHQIARFYARYRLKLLNENVRAFLQFTTKTNKAILATIKNDPVRFVSFNNGISIVARDAEKNFRTDACVEPCCLARKGDGKPASSKHDGEVDALWSLIDAQIVNGGQTSAAIYHASLDPDVRKSGAMSRVRVPVKITIVPGTEDERDDAIALIAKFSNTQNSIKPADLESNNFFFRQLQKIANETEVPSGTGAGTLWFFERTRGSYAETAALEDPAWGRVHPTSQVLNKYLLADVMNCIAGRPFDSQLGGDALFTRYLRWLRAGNAVAKKGLPSEKLAFSKEPGASYDELLSAEWKGAVGAVIVRRELEKIFAETEGWMRTISTRYVLALMYLEFSSRWESIWVSQDPFVIMNKCDREIENPPSQASVFADWVRRAGEVVREGVESARVLPGGGVRDLNYTAKLLSTWEEVLALARTRGMVQRGPTA